MARPRKPDMTEAEHAAAHAAGGLRTGAKAISRMRGAESASASASEREWRTVGTHWLRLQHKASGCAQTLGVPKPIPARENDPLCPNVTEVSDTRTRIGRSESTVAEGSSGGPANSASDPPSGVP